MKLRLFYLLILLATIATSSACIYRLDVPQGNRIGADVIAQLKTGMTTRQVEFLLGEPAITDPYHLDVWHYIYYFKSGDDGSIEKRVMTLRFAEDRLSAIEGSLIDY